MSDVIAVTGATGFVGRRLTARLADMGRKVRVLVRDPERFGPPRANEDVLEWEAGSTTEEHLEGVNIVCHAAAYLPPDFTDSRFAAECLRVNAMGTLDLLRAATAVGASAFVNFSSGNVYRDSDGPQAEHAPIYPDRAGSYYLASKMAAEVWASHFAPRIRVVTLRPSAVYGPGMAERGVVWVFAERLRRGEPVMLSDGGRHRADMVYVDDVVHACVMAFSRSVDGAFNVGSGGTSSVLEIAESMIRVLDADPDLMRVAPAADTPASGFAALDITRARELLDYEPTALDDGIRLMLQRDARLC